MNVQFPRDFLWGTATAATQIEGGLDNHDWYDWSVKGHTLDGSTPMQACDHYEKYVEDIELMEELNSNAYRFSLEWSRIEPERGSFSSQGLAFYRELIHLLKEKGIEPMVTLHHFTNPLWFSRKGGWEVKENLEDFRSYCAHVVQALGCDVKMWVTINEPTVYTTFGYMQGQWPPGKRGAVQKTFQVLGNMARAHDSVYRDIHRIYREKGLEAPQVGMAHHLRVMDPLTHSFKDRLAASFLSYVFNWWFFNKSLRRDTLDYIGLNYYTRDFVTLDTSQKETLFVRQVEKEGLPRNELGWEIYPQGLYRLLHMLHKKTKYPIYITENGIPGDDEDKIPFIRDHLQAMHKAMEEGVRVRGYFYWSLMDNFEWAHGYEPRFGLYQMDYSTQQRHKRKCCTMYSEIAKTGTLQVQEKTPPE